MYYSVYHWYNDTTIEYINEVYWCNKTWNEHDIIIEDPYYLRKEDFAYLQEKKTLNWYKSRKQKKYYGSKLITQGKIKHKILTKIPKTQVKYQVGKGFQ